MGKTPRRKSARAVRTEPGRVSTRVFALSLLAIVALSLLAGVGFWKWYVFNIKEVPIEVTVTNSTLLGFNTGTDKLYFGTLAPEGFGERKSSIVSSLDSIAVFKMRGVAGGWVTVSDNYMRLAPNQARDVTFRLTIPVGTPPGDYNGTAIIEYHRRMFWE